MRWLLFIIIAIGSLTLAYLLPELAFSPGKLSKAHQAKTQTCQDCHVDFQGIAQEKCSQCHQPHQFKAKTQFHQNLQGRCTSCHSEHNGAQPPKAQFAHQLLPAAQANQCQNCHKAPQDSLHKRAQSNCSACHGTNAFKPATFEHADYFRFDRHHPQTCENCHQAGNFAQYTCYGCHEHSPASIRGEHEEEGIRDFADCAACHPSGNEHEIHRRRTNRGNVNSAAIGNQDAWQGQLEQGLGQGDDDEENDDGHDEHETEDDDD